MRWLHQTRTCTPLSCSREHESNDWVARGDFHQEADAGIFQDAHRWCGHYEDQTTLQARTVLTIVIECRIVLLTTCYGRIPSACVLTVVPSITDADN